MEAEEEGGAMEEVVDEDEEDKEENEDEEDKDEEKVFQWEKVVRVASARLRLIWRVCTRSQTLPELQALLRALPAEELAVLDFWADWAAPCKQMNEVADELAKEYPSTLFVKVRTLGDSYLNALGPTQRPALPLTRPVPRPVSSAVNQQIPADDASDVVDAYNVEAVPTFVLLRVRAAPPPRASLVRTRAAHDLDRRGDGC